MQSRILQHPIAKKVSRYRVVVAQWKWLKTTLDKLAPTEVADEAADGSDRSSSVPPEAQPLSPIIALPGLEPLLSYYQQYPCKIGTPLNCAHALRAVQNDPAAIACPHCGFPTPLAAQTVIVGNQGSYRIEHCLGQRGIARLYSVTQIGSEASMTLREYVLPKRYFNEREQVQRQQLFRNLVGLDLADGRSQDLRVMTPIEAISPPNEGRAYLILPAEEQSLSLSHVLSNRSAFTGNEVYQVLRQVLQTLVGLHQQKYMLSPGRVQTGVVHGKVRLSSLLWVPQGSQWFIYLTDFAIWEECFNPIVLEVLNHDVQEDLAGLGAVAFYLLVGQLTDASGQRLNPKVDAHWPTVYPPLKFFILRLLGVEAPFEHAAAAHQALLQLPPEPITNEIAPASITVVRRRSHWRQAISLILWIAAIALGGWFLWTLLRPKPLEAQRTPPPCCFEEVGAVPEGSFTYTAIAGDVWEDLLRLQPQENPGQTVAQQLAIDQPKAQLRYQPSASVDEALEKLRTRQADFAVLPVLNDLPIDMASETIAYDGLAVVVAFNYQGRSQGLPDSLRGSITLAAVQELYQNPVALWNDVQPSIRLPLQRYVNRSPSVQTALRHFVLQDELPAGASPVALETIPMLRTIIRDFEENRIGSIGITSLSSIEGQCSVYPLAIQAPGQAAQQAIRQANGQPIQPDVDLCRRKGTYQIDSEALRSRTYPLAYPIAVVYRRDNRLPPIGPKFAALFLSEEGQSYIHQVNLIGVIDPPQAGFTPSR
ncbi:hypothetical protein ACQ4M4_18290 [Leptolyngbya sp. AN02str]|uniref:hypothetical protein n=1 Tax=Leptolyngbya sp. AN02str TaxID=3423363 RepID=UPI003D322A7C